MKRNQAEIEETQRFDALYRLSDSAVMQAVTDSVCCCGYIGTSWTTRQEADVILDRLDLKSTSHLLELGAGAGWPGIYLARQSGCAATLVDLPESGLKLANQRAKADGISDRISTIVADAANLPLAPQSFSTINHADLLCCLLPKKQVLEACRRVIRPDGRMTFSAIHIAPGLSQDDYNEAVENGPPFIASELSYPELLEATGWNIIDRMDITQAYQEACERKFTAERQHDDELRGLLGEEEYALTVGQSQSRLETVRKRLTLRMFYVATPG